MRSEPNDLPTTRGLLMALSRKRADFFISPLPGAIVISIATLGVGPLLKQTARLDAWRHFEWLQLHEFAMWLAPRLSDSRLPKEEGAGGIAALIADAERFSTPHGPDWTIRIAAVGSLVIVAIAALHGGWLAALDTAFQPQSLRPSALAHSALLSLAWVIVLARLLAQHARTTVWLASLSATLATIELRPVAARPMSIPWIGLALASLLAIVGPTWAAAMVATISLQNMLVRRMHAARLQLVERMLELTDDSGLPVEFDVGVGEPNAFVTARQP